ncbi:MAG: hypothetical protein K2I28_06450 [Muribaculaceae bacterium]|nr:hypothetical protein [Muribaculaceae bacterium]
MILGINSLTYKKSVSVYISQEDGRDKLVFWEAGLPRKGVCIAQNEDSLYLIRNSKIIFETKIKGDCINGDSSNYELLRSIKGYYILIHNYTGRTIRPGRDDDYYPDSSYTVFDEIGEKVEKWTGDMVGIDKYPTELGLGLVVLDNVVYELDSLSPLFIIPSKFKINGVFSKDGILKLDVEGDYRNFYVKVLNGNIISQHKEEDLPAVLDDLCEKRIDLLKEQSPILYKNLPSVKESTNYLNELGVMLPYPNSVATNQLYSKPYLCDLSWEQIIAYDQLPSELIVKISMIFTNLLSIDAYDPTKTSYVFKFSKDVNCRVFRKFFILFKTGLPEEIIIFKSTGSRLSNVIYKNRDFNRGFFAFDTSELTMFDSNIFNNVRLTIVGDELNTKIDYSNNYCYRHAPWSMDDSTIRPECFSGNILSYRLSNLGKAVTFHKHELEKFIGLRDYHKDAKFLFRLTYGAFCKFFQNYFIVVTKLHEEKFDDDWRMWIYNYDGKLLNSEYFIINGMYFTRALINYSANRVIVFNTEINTLQQIEIEQNGITTKNLEQASVVKSQYIDVKVVERIKNYLYTLDPEILDINDLGCGHFYFSNNNIFVLEHLSGKKTVSINGTTYQINPYIREKCMDEIHYRHRNRANFVTSIKFINNYHTRDGNIELYKFECRPYAICDTSGNIYYNFSIEDVIF